MVQALFIYCKMKSPVTQRLDHRSRHIRPALRVYKTTAAVSLPFPLPDIETRTVCRRRIYGNPESNIAVRDLCGECA